MGARTFGCVVWTLSGWLGSAWPLIKIVGWAMVCGWIGDIVF